MVEVKKAQLVKASAVHLLTLIDEWLKPKLYLTICLHHKWWSYIIPVYYSS